MFSFQQSPVPTTFGFVPHRPNSTFKPISSAVPSLAAGSSQQVSSNSLLDQVNLTQNGSPSSRNSIPCAQRSLANKQNSTQQGTPTHSQSSQSQQVPNQQNATSQQQFASRQANTQNVAPPQTFCTPVISAVSCCTPALAAAVTTTSTRLPCCTLAARSHKLYNLGLALKANLSGNLGNHHHLDNVLILLHSLSFQLQRYNKIQCLTPRNPESQSLQMDRE